MSDQRTEAEYAYFILLVAEGRECDHPIAFRHAYRDDPMEWECGICGTVQLRKRA